MVAWAALKSYQPAYKKSILQAYLYYMDYSLLIVSLDLDCLKLVHTDLSIIKSHTVKPRKFKHQLYEILAYSN